MQLGYKNYDLQLGPAGEPLNLDELEAKLDTELVILAQKKAKEWHNSVNQKYDGKPYFDVHITSVNSFVEQFIYLIPFPQRGAVRAGGNLHDTMEDCRKTYNDITNLFGFTTANIVYACTNDKGKTRKERAGAKYYRGIRNTPYATYVKLCDRLANMTYSQASGSNMFKVYQKEHPDFINSLKGTKTWLGKIRYWIEEKLDLHETDYSVLYAELDKLVNQPNGDIKANTTEG